MKTILSSNQMSSTDTYNIEELGMPSLVLMERAALKCVEKICEIAKPEYEIGVICGPGNNGGDGVAIARILSNMGYKVSYTVLGKSDRYSEQLKKEIEIANNYNVNQVTSYNMLFDLNDCVNANDDTTTCKTSSEKIIVDAIFGIGLSREVTGEYKDAIEYINKSSATVFAVDIPSGYSADTGAMLGIGVKADYTVTFAYGKKGLFLSDCYLNKGELTVADVGIYLNNPSANCSVCNISKDISNSNDNGTFKSNDICAFNSDDNAHMCYLLEDSDLKQYIPATKTSDNKGSRGKVLVIAGSKNIYGACYLSAKAALSSGTGLVKIYTHVNNLNAIRAALPEAMYESYSDEINYKSLDNLLTDAKCVLIGPGIGTDIIAEELLKYVVCNAQCPIVIDADGINILSNDVNLLACAKSPIVLTPHLKEMNRLCGAPVKDINLNMEKYATEFCNTNNVNMILKNYTSYIVTPSADFINITGNEGMATAGSGDVLAGILASLLGQGISMDIAPALASYIHGKAGEKASIEKGKRQMLASDIIDNIII